MQDEFGQILGRVLLARKGSFSRRIALVLEVQGGSPEQLRKAALAAIVIADLKMATFNSGYGGSG